jgi:hypothetical protein
VKRRVFHVVVGVSLVLCVATVAFWVRSWHRGQSIERVDADRRNVATSMAGLIQLTRWDGAFSPPTGSENELDRCPPAAWQKWKYWRGLDVGSTDSNDWAYQPWFDGLDGDHWWQPLGFDASDRQVIPKRGPPAVALHDWLQPWTWSGRVRSLVVPHWAVPLAFLALPAIALLRLVQRSDAGRCNV